MPTETLRPNAPGDLCQVGSQVGDPCPNHWMNVDEAIPDEDTTYIFAYYTEDYQSDLYHLQDPPPQLTEIESVTLFTRVRRYLGYAYFIYFKQLLKTYGMTYEKEYRYFSTEWSTFSWEFPTNPFTHLPWTAADLAALQVGVALKASHIVGISGRSECTQVYVEVDYAAVPPTVSADPATSVVANSSTLNGTLDDDGGEACDCGFEWGKTVAYGNTTSTQSKNTGEIFSQAISGLDPATTYHFRAFATNAAGTSYSADRTFTTLGVTSSVTTDPATGVGMVLANLNGTLDDDGGVACDCGFQWGETVAYGNTTPTQSKVTGETFSQAISGLTPGTTYHFKAFSTNVSGTSYGDDRTFITAEAISRGYALSRHEL